MKISKTQQEALDKMNPDEWYSSYEIGFSLSTMFALKDKGLVKMQGNDRPGAFSSPRIIIEFCKPSK